MRYIFLFLSLLCFLNAKYETIEFTNSDLNPLSDFSKEKLLKVLPVEYPPIYKFWQSDPVFFDKDIKDFKENLFHYLQSKGFYNSKVEVIKDKKKLIFKLIKNSQATIKNIKIDSNFDIENLIDLKSGDKFDTKKFKTIKAEIQSKLLSSGYAKFELSTKAYVDLEQNSVDIAISLDKKELCYFGDISIEKIDDIKEKFFTDEIEFKKGEIYSLEKIERTYENLYSKNIFQEVNIDVNREKNSSLPIHIFLKKAKERVFKSYLGINSDSGITLNANFTHKNFFGDLKRLEVDLKLSSKNQSFENRFTIPKFLTKEITFENLFKLENSEFEQYDEKKISNRVSLNRDFYDFKSYFGLLAESSKIETDNKNLFIKDGDYFINSIFLKGTKDRRDSKLNAKNGYYISLNLEQSSKIFKSEFDFLKSLIELRYIKTFNKLTLASKAKIGFISSSVPSFKRFFAGGAFSNRGYNYRDVGSRDNLGNALGGESIFDSSLEARYQIYPKISLAIFYDTTILNSRHYDLSSKAYNSLGAGFRYLTPIGALRFDFGKALDDGFNFHFSIGEAF